MNQTQTAQKTRRSAAASVVLLVLLVLMGVAFLKRDALYDWWQLRNYTPPAAVAQLAADTSMTERAEHLFYINKPEQKARESFSTFCPSGTEQSVVLGCYLSGQRGIYLLKVDNAELSGIEQVTAAHEMLHAAYDRLSSKDRDAIDTKLENYYQTQLSDDTIKKTIDEYKISEPNDVTNEMHSIFGTQIVDLPSDLQQYYAQYFTDRSKVTGYYASYEEAFNGRRDQIKQYDAQLNSWKTEIDQLEDSVQSQQKALAARREALQRYESQGNVSAYNGGVDVYNQAVRAYNGDVTRLQSLITQYNDMVNDRNAIAFEQRELVKSLSSPAATQQ